MCRHCGRGIQMGPRFRRWPVKISISRHRVGSGHLLSLSLLHRLFSSLPFPGFTPFIIVTVQSGFFLGFCSISCRRGMFSAAGCHGWWWRAFPAAGTFGMGLHDGGWCWRVVVSDYWLSIIKFFLLTLNPRPDPKNTAWCGDMWLVGMSAVAWCRDMSLEILGTPMEKPLVSKEIKRLEKERTWGLRHVADTSQA